MAFEIPVRVYIEDTDAGGIVFYGNYLKFLERARTDFLRSLGIKQSVMIENNLMFVVRHVSIDYKLSASLDDILIVSCLIKSMRKIGVVFTQQVTRASDQALLVNADIEVVCVSSDGLRPRAMPDPLLNQLQIKTERNDV